MDENLSEALIRPEEVLNGAEAYLERPSRNSEAY